MTDFLNKDYWQEATPESVKEAIENGADVNVREEDGWTTLMLASKWNKNPAITQTLIDNGVNVNAQGVWGWTALMVAALHNENSDIITTLLTNGADVKIRNYEDFTAWDYIQNNEHLRETEVYYQLKPEKVA